jgi:hypothetical protein
MTAVEDGREDSTAELGNLGHVDAPPVPYRRVGLAGASYSKMLWANCSVPGI